MAAVKISWDEMDFPDHGSLWSEGCDLDDREPCPGNFPFGNKNLSKLKIFNIIPDI